MSRGFNPPKPSETIHRDTMTVRKITIEIAGEKPKGELTDKHSPETFQKIADSLPLESIGKKWGDEIYFSIPVEMGEENPKESVRKGAIAFWPQGNAFCIFYGKTPLTEKEDKIIPASPVNVVGKIERLEKLKKLKSGKKVRVYFQE